MDMVIIYIFLITNCDIHMYSLGENKIEAAGAQALAEGLQREHCTDLQELK